MVHADARGLQKALSSERSSEIGLSTSSDVRVATVRKRRALGLDRKEIARKLPTHLPFGTRTLIGGVLRISRWQGHLSGDQHSVVESLGLYNGPARAGKGETLTTISESPPPL